MVQVGSRDERYHFIATVEDYLQLGKEHFRPAGDRQLFDYRTDPRLGRDLASEDSPAERDANLDLLAWKESALGRATVESDLTPEQRAELRDLGYFGD